jgi:hypothetical protein
MKNFTIRELQLIQHALSYMYSNLDDVNECLDVNIDDVNECLDVNIGYFKEYSEEEVQSVKEKLDVNNFKS